MMPGMTYLPVPSMTWAPAGTARSFPTAAIFPFRIRMVPLSIVPWLAVMMVALVTATSVPAGGMVTLSTGLAGRPALSCRPAAGAPGVWAASTPAISGRLKTPIRFMASSPR
jgi:hypothetical protein